MYVRSMIFAAFLNAVSGSPSFRKTLAGSLARCCIFWYCDSELSKPAGTTTSCLPPKPLTVSFVSLIGSHCTLNFFLAFITSQVVLPTITSNSLNVLVSKAASSKPSSNNFMLKTSVMPGIFKAWAASKDLSFIPKAGGCCIIAINIPSCL